MKNDWKTEDDVWLHLEKLPEAGWGKNKIDRIGEAGKSRVAFIDSHTEESERHSSEGVRLSMVSIDRAAH